MSSNYLSAMRCENGQGRTPIWIMRQAGRYLPEYRQLRDKYAPGKLLRTPELIAQVTELPLTRLGTDAAILYSDILIVLDALGVEWEVMPRRGPVIRGTLSPQAYLRRDNVREKLGFIATAIRELKSRIDVPLIGFAGAPFTIAAYLIEGGASRDLKRTKVWMYRDPAGFRALLDLITDCIVEFLEMQIEAGIDAIQLFDSWAGKLAAGPFQHYSLEYLQKILTRLENKVPVTIYGQGLSFYALYLAELEPSCLGLDWQCDIAQMRDVVPEQIALQGNLDPYLLYADWSTVKEELDRILQAMHRDPGFILNLGHGVLPDTPVEMVQRMVEYTKEFAPSVE